MKGFLSSIKKKARAQSASAISDEHHASAAAGSSSASSSQSSCVAFTYSGSESSFGITFQRARAKFVDADGPTRLQWLKDQRLGITFAEKEGGAIAVKSANAVDVAVGQELIGVNGQPVVGLDFLTVMDLLQSASSPCQLDFTPPPSPVVVAQVDPGSAAHAHGVTAGMVLLSVDGASMIGATLGDVNRAVLRASAERPVVLRLAYRAPRGLTRSDSDPRSDSGKPRNFACLAAVAAVLAV